MMTINKSRPKTLYWVGKPWADGQVGRIFLNLCPRLKTYMPQGLKCVGRWADCPRTLPTCPRAVSRCHIRGFRDSWVGTQTPILKYRHSAVANAITLRMYSRMRTIKQLFLEVT
jgi:hypothetical protein